MSKTLSQVYYFDSGKKHITSLFKKQLVSLFEEYNLYNREVIILCIGSTVQPVTASVPLSDMS